MEGNIITWDDGWDYLEKGIIKMKRRLKGLPEPPFNPGEYRIINTYSSFYFILFYFLIEFVHNILLCNVFVFVCYTVITLIPSAQSGAKNVYANAPSRLLSTAL